MRRCGFIFKLFIVVIFFFVSPKKANADDLDNRLAELEKKNFELRKLLRIEALEKENAALSQKLNLKPMGSPTQETLGPIEATRGDRRAAYDTIARYHSIKAESTAAPYVPLAERLAPRWAGAYWGASAGGGITRSRVNASEQYSTNFAAISYPDNINVANMTDASGPGHRGGALIDVFAGWNFQLSHLFVVGGQIEATVADLSFNSSGTRTFNDFNGAGPTGQTAVEDFRPQVSSNAMASALLRVGLLSDDKTLIYGIGGLTVAQFQTRNLADESFYQLEESFLARGWTIGAGIERRLDSNWSVRAEYRYTNFGSHSSNGQFNYASSSGTETYQRYAQFDQSMQVGRIGIAYAIGGPR